MPVALGTLSGPAADVGVEGEFRDLRGQLNDLQAQARKAGALDCIVYSGDKGFAILPVFGAAVHFHLALVAQHYPVFLYDAFSITMPRIRSVRRPFSSNSSSR